MKSFKNMQNRINSILRRAWVTLGIPFDSLMVNEKEEGIIDVESLIMATLLIMRQDRIVTDMPAWVNRFSGFINHQKLKSMLKAMSQAHRALVLKNLNQGYFLGGTKSFKKVFNLKKQATDNILETIGTRLNKLNTIQNVAQASIMIHNRLLYGTGFRADLITLTYIKGLRMKGTEFAKLLCTNDSTISRLLNDLKTCQFLNTDNEMVGHIAPYPGMFISTQSVWNLCEIIDTYKFVSHELIKDTMENLNFKQDAFGRQVVKEMP